MTRAAISPTLAETAFPARIDRPAQPLRKFANLATAGAVALSLVLGSVLPARAGSDDLAKGLLAALVLGVIVHEVGKADAAPAPKPEPVHGTRPWPPQYSPYYPPPPPPPPHGGWKPPHHPPRPMPQPEWRPRLPSYCAVNYDGRGGGGWAFSGMCLQRDGFSYRLPPHCGTEVRIRGRWDRLYGAECLARNGFEVRGRR